ncbi:single-stranded DNA-binding protein [Halobacteroides halobius DSM 5150]|uniref:Single-stranded DNA-binding protein n=1 Tax=Halobacteroides halobius (strain ATCC 35273 / DSM 5150 / MD-1) TaxID=748449 RepID=L0KBU6_HALHC|nr:single-stranded DNA-binding protein [Halobacteroides halobius]AGB42481.1 single-stranded DNA-binding protein [Halobacteroides halobius DSM 5150]
MLNKVILIGRLTDDPELRYTPSGTAVCNFTLAVERNFRNQNGEYDTDFIDIVVWRKQAENCANYLSKGRLAAAEGRLQIRSYENNEGQRRRVTEIVANSVQFLEYSNNNNNNNNQNNNQGQSSAEEDIDVPF